jgi:hypothetical protein
MAPTLGIDIKRAFVYLLTNYEIKLTDFLVMKYIDKNCTCVLT